MKKLFPGYYHPSAAELKQLWQESLLVCDAWVLLNLFRCSEQTSLACLNMLEENRDRLWLPYRAAEEYHEKLEEVFAGEKQFYGQAITRLKVLSDIYHAYRGQLFTDLKLERRLLRLLADLKGHYTKREEILQGNLINNPIQDKIAELFEGRVGRPYSSKRLDEIFLLGEERVGQRRPPLPDPSAAGELLQHKFGGLVLWMQLLDQAETTAQSVLLISGEMSQRWFTLSFDMPSPHPQLISEFKARTGEPLYICTFHQYLGKANTLLKSGINPGLIEEVGLAFQGAASIRRENWPAQPPLAELATPASAGGPGKVKAEQLLSKDKLSLDQGLLKRMNELLKHYTSEDTLFRQSTELLKVFAPHWKRPDDFAGGTAETGQEEADE